MVFMFSSHLSLSRSKDLAVVWIPFSEPLQCADLACKCFRWINVVFGGNIAGNATPLCPQTLRHPNPTSLRNVSKSQTSNLPIPRGFFAMCVCVFSSCFGGRVGALSPPWSYTEGNMCVANNFWRTWLMKHTCITCVLKKKKKLQIRSHHQKLTFFCWDV